MVAPGACVGVAHHRAAGIAHRIEVLDRAAVLPQHAGVAVGAETALGAEVAGDHFDGEERRLLERPEARIGLVAGIPVVVVVTALTTAEVLVLAVPGESVETRDRFGECVDRHADLPGQLGDGARLDDHTGLQPATRERGARG